MTVISTTGELGVAETVDITAGLTVGSQEFYIERYQVTLHVYTTDCQSNCILHSGSPICS